MRRAVVLLCALAFVVGGCARGDDPAKPIRTVEPQNTASSPSVDPQAARDAEGCQLLTAKERRSIAGMNLDIVAPQPAITDVLQCTWVKSLSSTLTTFIKVTSQPVQVWVKTIPKQVDRIMVTGKPNDKLTQRLKRIKTEVLRGPNDIADDEACDILSVLVEANGGEKNADQFLLYQGTGRGDFTVTWNRCAGGVHTAFVYGEPALQASVPLSQSVVRLGKVSHKRAVKELQ